MTRTLPADGHVIWRVTTAAGTRWLRLRKGGTPLLLPAAAAAEAVPLPDAEALAAAAPRHLRELWRLAEAAPGWGWILYPVPAQDGAGAPAGWHLAVESPAGAWHRYTWVRHGASMRLAAATETIRAVAAQIGP